MIKGLADLLIFLSHWLSLSDYVHALKLMTDLYLAFKHVMCTKTHKHTHTVNLNAPFSLKQKVPLSSTWWSYQEGWENYPATHSRATNQIALYCCVKSKQTSKGVFICCWPRKCVRGATVTPFMRLMTRSILVIHGANEISIPWASLIHFLEFASSTLFPHFISESHSLVRTEIINFVTQNRRQSKRWFWPNLC